MADVGITQKTIKILRIAIHFAIETLSLRFTIHYLLMNNIKRCILKIVEERFSNIYLSLVDLH
ncbi:MAG: hypothetical protein CVV30_10345 [Methanomicrobiales archaeon HGW-Methanomicrobiales-1]|nr:MAG: hypothetical protein CVV30_10345 [Methanomicrobiales archaeon HGW-Methanomicrobiales-1]